MQQKQSTNPSPTSLQSAIQSPSPHASASPLQRPIPSRRTGASSLQQAMMVSQGKKTNKPNLSFRAVTTSPSALFASSLSAQTQSSFQKKQRLRVVTPPPMEHLICREVNGGSGGYQTPTQPQQSGFRPISKNPRFRPGTPPLSPYYYRNRSSFLKSPLSDETSDTMSTTSSRVASPCFISGGKDDTNSTSSNRSTSVRLKTELCMHYEAGRLCPFGAGK